MKIEKVTFEGTPEEFKAIDYVFMNSPSSGSEPHNQEREKKVTAKDAYKAMLRRAPIRNGQRDMYKTLAEGELEFGEYLTRMGRSPEQIRGVHGALGKRINNTPEIHQAGLPGNMSAVVIWRKEGNKDFLRLKPDFLEVLKEEELI